MQTADHHAAYLKLASIDFNGRGRPRAIIQDFKWMLIATRGNPQLRQRLRQLMDPEITSDYRARAHAYVKAWLRAKQRSIADL